MTYTLPYTRTSDDYKPCVALWPSGEQRKANVHYVRLMDVPTAVGALKSGKIAFVAPDDTEAVRQTYNQNGS